MNEVDSIEITKTKVAARRMFDSETRRRLKFDSREHYDLLIAELWGYFDTETIEKEWITFEYLIPRTWFDRFRLEVFPAWLLRHFPPNMKAQRACRAIKHKCVFPKISEFSDDYKGVQFKRIIEPTFFEATEDE